MRFMLLNQSLIGGYAKIDVRDLRVLTSGLTTSPNFLRDYFSIRCKSRSLHCFPESEKD